MASRPRQETVKVALGVSVGSGEIEDWRAVVHLEIRRALQVGDSAVYFEHAVVGLGPGAEMHLPQGGVHKDLRVLTQDT